MINSAARFFISSFWVAINLLAVTNAKAFSLLATINSATCFPFSSFWEATSLLAVTNSKAFSSLAMINSSNFSLLAIFSLDKVVLKLGDINIKWNEKYICWSKTII